MVRRNRPARDADRAQHSDLARPLVHGHHGVLTMPKTEISTLTPSSAADR
jgi:hypothetical protein